MLTKGRNNLVLQSLFLLSLAQEIFSGKREKMEIDNWLKYGGDVVDIVDKKEAERKKDLEEKRQKAGIPTQEELDNIGFTH